MAAALFHPPMTGRVCRPILRPRTLLLRIGIREAAMGWQCLEGVAVDPRTTCIANNYWPEKNRRRFEQKGSSPQCNNAEM